MTQPTSLPPLFTNGRLSSNVVFNQSTANNSSLSSFRQILLNSPNSNHVFPTHNPLKKLKPEPWQRLFDNQKTEQKSRVKQPPENVNVMIDEDFINFLSESSITEESSRYSFLPHPIQTHIDHLYEQINDLTKQLSEERIKHKQARINDEEILAEHFKNQEKQFQELLEEKLSDHKQELKEQENKYFKLLNEEKTQSLVREEKLRQELNFVKKSFHSYTMNLEKENAEKIQMKVNQTLIAMEKELPKKEEEINTRINEAILKERKNLQLRQKIEIENIRKQHNKEIQNIHKTVADTTVDRTHAELLNQQLTLTKVELNETKEHVLHLSTKLNHLEMQYIETTRELNECRLRLEEKTVDRR